MPEVDPIRYMLDTSAVNWILDNISSIDRLSDLSGKLTITHVQRDELARTPEEGRRRELQNLLASLAIHESPVSTWVWGDTPWESICWPEDDGLFERIQQEIALSDKRRKKKERRLNQSRDARIVEAAVRANLIVVTADPGMRDATKLVGGRVLHPGELIES